jgi:Zn-dependent protease
MEMGGFKIGTIRGIPIRVHITFLIVLPILAVGFARTFRVAAHLAEVPPEKVTGSPFLWGVGMALALFLSVLLHELGHSLYSIRKGGKVRDITLLMIGGVSQMSEMPREPRHEAMMALVGPLVSLGLGVLLYGLHALSAGTSFGIQFGLFYLAGLNLFLGLFNLLPAFPMDGGRILRGVLTPRLGALRATRIAATVGKVFAVLFGIWGLLTLNLILVLIGFFVFVGAQSEQRATMMKLGVWAPPRRLREEHHGHDHGAARR